MGRKMQARGREEMRIENILRGKVIRGGVAVCWCLLLFVLLSVGVYMVSNYIPPVGCILWDCEHVEITEKFVPVVLQGTTNATEWTYFRVKVTVDETPLDLHYTLNEPFCIGVETQLQPTECTDTEGMYPWLRCDSLTAYYVIGVFNNATYAKEYQLELEVTNAEQEDLCTMSIMMLFIVVALFVVVVVLVWCCPLIVFSVWLCVPQLFKRNSDSTIEPELELEDLEDSSL